MRPHNPSHSEGGDIVISLPINCELDPSFWMVLLSVVLLYSTAVGLYRYRLPVLVLLSVDDDSGIVFRIFRFGGGFTLLLPAAAGTLARFCKKRFLRRRDKRRFEFLLRRNGSLEHGSTFVALGSAQFLSRTLVSRLYAAFSSVNLIKTIVSSVRKLISRNAAAGRNGVVAAEMRWRRTYEAIRTLDVHSR